MGFFLGDLSCDGHCMYQRYHIVSNYSAKEITEAYQELSEELKWDFLKECNDFGENFLTKEGTQHLLKLGIITESDVQQSLDYYGRDSYIVEDCNVFVTIFFKLVKVKLPDLEWDYRIIDEDRLSILNGTAYGAFM